MTSPNKDIADFYILVRDKENTILFEKFLSYDERVVEISEDELPKSFEDHIEVCVLAKDSDGVIGSWFNSQCFDLTTNFESVVRKYNANYNYEYSIVSPKKKGTSSDELAMRASGDGVNAAVINFKIILLCYLVASFGINLFL